MYNVHLWHINCAFYALAEVPYNVVPKVHFFLKIFALLNAICT